MLQTAHPIGHDSQDLVVIENVVSPGQDEIHFSSNKINPVLHDVQVFILPWQVKQFSPQFSHFNSPVI